MSKYRQFIFSNYSFDFSTKTLSLHYSIDDELHFTETFVFDYDLSNNLNQQLLDVACQTVFFMAGVSYYKTYLPPEITVLQGELDAQSAAFFSKTYQKGLGEFFYVNKLDPKTQVQLPVTTPVITVPQTDTSFEGKLIAIGGGKDSLTSLELLKDEPTITTWAVSHRSQLAPQVERTGRPHIWVERHWDSQLTELNKRGAYNGHVPISALFAALGTVIAVLTGSKDIVVSNESSASEPTLMYEGVAVNHQYSKSLEFEQDFQSYLLHRFAGSIRYYSLLRQFSELRIAELFSAEAFEKYKDVFSSCNRAYRQGEDHMWWCGECPKCAFVFLILTPFVSRHELEAIWGGKNLLLDEGLEKVYSQLLGVEGDKPLECVGEIKESRAAMRLAQKLYPELGKYAFDLPADYDFRALAPHSIPEDVLPALRQPYKN